MTTTTPQPGSASGRRGHSLRIDMTPMVDLGFLLITFFIFTATISQPSITRLIMPAKGESTGMPASRSLTLLLDRERAFVYEGLWEGAISANALVKTTYNLQNGLGRVIRQKQKSLAEKDGLVVLIKPLPSASYQNIITALDEMLINDVKKYAITEATAQEVEAAGNR